MKIRDAHATINGFHEEYEMPSGGLEIIADDGRPLFCITLNKDGSIALDTGTTCKHNDILLGTGMRIQPRASNLVIIHRTQYEGKP